MRHEIFKNFVSSVEAGIGMEGQIMCILDVISSVSRSSKCTNIVRSWGFAPNFTGSSERSPDSVAGFKGPTFNPSTSKRREWEWIRVEREGKRGRGAKMIYAPGARNPRTVTAVIYEKTVISKTMMLKIISILTTYTNKCKKLQFYNSV